MPFFTRVFRSKDSNTVKKTSKNPVVEDSGPAKPTWTDAWQRTEVAPEEVQELLRGCTQELKARANHHIVSLSPPRTALHTPFILLPFRPSVDASAARTFIRNYFTQSLEKGSPLGGDALSQELRLSDPMVICSVMKWCWSRLPGGVVTWEAYELFKVGEQGLDMLIKIADSQFARDAFTTFIPISIDSDARTKIIFDFFDLLAAIAAHGKNNGLGGRKLSRYAGWWAFDHVDTGNGFESAYKNWAMAADATSHLFFAYLRSLSPESRGMGSISTLPIALQTLVQATEYPPEIPTLLQVSTTKVVMIVDTVSPTPFALLRRAKNFEYRDSDEHLQEFSSFDEPLRALTDECVRVLRCISSTNQSVAPEPTSSPREATWSRFEDMGFGSALESESAGGKDTSTAKKEFGGGLRSAPQSGGGDLGRPMTPSWADFMSSGFSDEKLLRAPVTPMLLPPDKVLPPIAMGRGQSSQSHKRVLDSEPSIDPGELASITTLDLDDSFWWVWISSLAGEEPVSRKAVFGRCALLETVIKNTKWLVLEEQVKGAAPEPEPGAYIVEKKRFFGFSTRKRLGRRKSSAKKVSAVEEAYKRPDNQAPQSKSSIAPDQHARIQAAAAALQRRHREEQEAVHESRTRNRDTTYSKTNSVMTLQPSIMNEASHALKWASNYDKHAYRTAYLSDTRAGTGTVTEEEKGQGTDRLTPPASPAPNTSTKQPPPVPKDNTPPSQNIAVEGTRVAEGNEERRNGSTSAPVQQMTTSESLPRQSVDSTEDSSRKLKKKPGNTGFKSMFGTKKKNDQDARPPMKPTGAERSAVAAARAALEGKAKASQEQPTRPSTLRKKPAPQTPPKEAPKASVETPTTPKVEEHPAPLAAETRPAAVEAPHASPANDERPRHPREAEYDTLSRVDTNERAAADQEFSRFDQGPLLDQPAFVPAESPVSESYPKKEEDKENEKPIAAKTDETQKDTSAQDRAPSPSDQSINPSYDRWAQIRKNAAERAALERPRLSEDGGNTSEEESFESRAARIKARVAELTGNMQANK
ncbi:hypothetical protein FE257_000500 [Aspergillus nanangensis]|uniref:Meiotically up-regulated protein Msb1/Mug8 domain-containing protein n=1 Tax=Aspergillus nanangensis TaxID=2582783 RepID=A0AAD4CW52_ASPNN|nr:hypothetical protein FE257_000500 [Aspergillus nanangensis]